MVDMMGRNNTWKWEDSAHLLPIRVLMVIASHPVPSIMMGVAPSRELDVAATLPP